MTCNLRHPMSLHHPVYQLSCFAHKHTYPQTNTCIHTRTHTFVCSHTHTHTNTRRDTHIQTCTHIHTRTRAHINTQRTGAHLPTYTSTCKYIHAHTFIHPPTDEPNRPPTTHTLKDRQTQIHPLTLTHTLLCTHTPSVSLCFRSHSRMRWLRWVGSIKLQVSFAKEPYKRDNILQKRPIV